MRTTSHIVEYRGWNVYFENGLYWIGKEPNEKYFSFQEVKNQIDKMEHENNISTTIQQKKEV